MGNNYFWPEDIIREILLRLPVQSLLRFKTVSKFWFDVITSSNFIDSHYQHPSKPKRFVILTQRRELYSISVLPGGINRVDDRSMPFALEADKYAAEIVATRQYRELPPNRICYSQAQGFGFHHGINDYKLLQVAYRKNGQLEAKVLALSTGSWRKVEDTLPSYDYGIAKPVVVKGVWYHMATTARETPFIISLSFKIDIWLMSNEQSWTKVLTCSQNSVPISDVGLLPLGFWVDEESIISENYKRDGLSLFNLSTKQSKVVVVDEARRFGSAHRYVESMVSVYPTRSQERDSTN
ncbi:PREDICTED: putative F-box protein At3g52320 [Populus euphratica]|uniref:F-box protein At3g52320 n=1 Tax=Populus euphratica TaxID=75702 RepID=A0AAJ6VA94_POPEU|nr:PREDICTED: putative F-box protein At3g52320 [Populus euphratica]